MDQSWNSCKTAPSACISAFNVSFAPSPPPGSQACQAASMRPWTSVATGTRDDHHAPTLLGRSLRLQSCTSCSESGEAIAVCVGWKHLSMIYYNFMPLPRAMIMPCLIQMNSLKRLVHPSTSSWHHELLSSLAQHDWHSVLKQQATHEALRHQCLLCAEHFTPEDIFQHYEQSHGYLDTYGPLFAGMWMKFHLAHTAFVTPCTLCEAEYPKLDDHDVHASFRLLKHQCPIIVQLAQLCSAIVVDCINGRHGHAGLNGPVHPTSGHHGSIGAHAAAHEACKRKRPPGGEETTHRNTVRHKTHGTASDDARGKS